MAADPVNQGQLDIEGGGIWPTDQTKAIFSGNWCLLPNLDHDEDLTSCFNLTHFAVIACRLARVGQIKVVTQIFTGF